MTAKTSSRSARPGRRGSVVVAALVALALLAGACSSDDDPVDATAEPAQTDNTGDAPDEAQTDNTGDASDEAQTDDDTSDPASDPDVEDTDGASTTAEDDAAEVAEPDDAGTTGAALPCDEIAALFGTDGSANPDMADPESSAVCDGETIVISSNAIPDYPYIETSPGPPRAQDLTYSIPAEPTVAAEITAVPLLGSLGVTLAGIPIYGPTEGTGGDVGSLPGILMECGGHNGPTGFHLHLVGTSETTDCDFSPEELASGPQLLGYAFDGYPIYTGNAQYESSWELTDESLFASDTWDAHSYVEGSADLDECNGRTDENGNYAYYTTDAFPYIIGCFVGEVEIEGPGAGGAQGGGGRERPERDDGPPADGEGEQG